MNHSAVRDPFATAPQAASVDLFSADQPTSEPTALRRRIGLRAVALGAVLVPLNCFWVIRIERVLYGPYPSTISLFANVVFLLFLLVGINSALHRVVPRIALTQGELLTLYTMLAISTGLAGTDGVPIVAEMVPFGAWFGKLSQHSDWARFLGGFPSWAVIRDPAVVQGHFLGHSSFYRPEVLRAWSTPILVWTLFYVLLLLAAYCICVLVRPQWADRERLTFPITWLPMEMTGGGSAMATAFYRNPLMWGGFALAGTLCLWNGIAFLYPSLPSLPLGLIDLKPYIHDKPWSAIDWLPTTLYPLVIGMCFLLPLDLLFSCWFFFLLSKAQLVVANVYAWDTTPSFPFIREQGFGALVGLFLYYVWSGRRAYLAVWRSAWHRKSADELSSRLTPHGSRLPPQEALSERAALLGLAIGIAGLIAFCRCMGVAWWVAVTFFAIFIPSIVVVSRIRAELGSPVHDFHFVGPDNMIPRSIGATSLSQQDLIFFTFSFTITRAHRSDCMPIGLEGLQMARLRRLEATRMLAAIGVATVVGVVGTFWAQEHQAYTLGAAAKFSDGYYMPDEAFRRLNDWVGGAQDPHGNLPAVTAMAAGGLFTLALMFLRSRFFGFPFHPIGYAVSTSWAIHLVWLPMLIAWMIKGTTLRYGGLRAYRRFLPFFLGLILGDCVVGSLWALLAGLLNARMYNFFGA